MENTVRSFIAVELNPKIQQALSLVQDRLKDSAADVRWVKPANIHVTLKFLGNVSEEKLEAIKKEMTKAVRTLPSFSITIEGLGAFPKNKNPRILWVGIKKGAEELKQLAMKLEAGLEPLGFKKEERDFSPHITLGRLNSYESKTSLTEALEKPSSLPPLEQEIHRVVLFKSTLAPQGSLYEPLASVDLT